jgi:very-short-patch-repair endonuclease
VRGNKIGAFKKRKPTQFARNLRRHETDAERNLWSRLRNGQVAGMKFRRQQPIGNYIVDFICFEKRLIIEVDGSQHTDPLIEARDQDRKISLESGGYRILRFWDNEVLTNIEGVLSKILSALNEI